MMQPATGKRRLVGRPTRWTSALLISMAWMVVIALAVLKLKGNDAVFVAIAGLGAALATFGVSVWYEHARWRGSAQRADGCGEIAEEGTRRLSGVDSSPHGRAGRAHS